MFLTSKVTAGLKERVQSKTDLCDWDVPKINTAKVGPGILLWHRMQGDDRDLIQRVSMLEQGTYRIWALATPNCQLLLKPTGILTPLDPSKMPFLQFSLKPSSPPQCFNTGLKWIPFWLEEFVKFIFISLYCGKDLISSNLRFFLSMTLSAP